MKEKLTEHLGIKVTKTMKADFIKKASKYDDPSVILRELILGFIEDRLIIEPPKNHPLYGEHK